MKYLLFLLVTGLCLLAFKFKNERNPLDVDFKESASYRWLNKKVIESRLLDDMENLETWHSFTTAGGAVVDARVVTKIVDSSGSVAALELNKEQVHKGTYCLLMKTPVRLAGLAPSSGRGWGRSGVRRHFDGEDWSHFNRISIWIYPDLPGFYTTALDCRLYNDGIQKIPALFGQEGETSLILRNHEWNHVVWEISNVARDKITAFEMSYGLSGNMAGEADSIKFYFDQMDLERVDPDKIEGWDVWQGRISYSHAGYQTGANKTAIANNINAKNFEVINQESGEVVLSKPVESVSSHIGNFQVMDFSEIRSPGLYVLKAGEISTAPFKIDADVWNSSLWKALNFFYSERCGMDIPGVHGPCHRDWTAVHDNKRMIINGGWHDAGDLTQGLENTGEITYALFSNAEKLRGREENEALYKRVLEEACWGLDWVMKTSFGDGFRNQGSISSRRTNNIIGDDDDITATARNSPMTNFECAAIEALAWRVLKDNDPRLAAQALQMAKLDWKFAVTGMPSVKKSKEIWRGSFDSDNVEHELLSQAVVAAVDLWRATGDAQFADSAADFARKIMAAQQRERTDWDIPMTGFYYTTSEKDRLLHYCHRGREQGPTLALTMLCNAFPDHADWMKWYSSITLYSEYLKQISAYTAPYNVMPSSVYSDTEYLHVPESRKPFFKKQVLKGVSLGKGHYLRLFPVWMDYRGHFGTILPQAQALANAAKLRGDLASAQLSEHQLEWIIGKNPFSQSTMWGEGHDFVPLYTPSSGDIVGALPVGIQSRGDDDAPYWPVQNTWTYKEIWVHPVARWVWLLKDISGNAFVQGMSNGPVQFKEASTGEKTIVTPGFDGHFKTMLPEGKYMVISNGGQQMQTFLPGSSYQLELRTGVAVNFDVTKTTSSNGEITIVVKATGSGKHKFSIRTDNLVLTSGAREALLQPNATTTFEWRYKPENKQIPWVAVVFPDDNLSLRKEVRGAVWER